MDQIKEILAKYDQEEIRIQTLLRENENSKLMANNKASEEKNKCQISMEQAIKRNKELLQELETVKGNLRSKAIYSPTEMQWEEICRRYREEPSLPVTTWKCHIPVFV